jgi:hypothetical protein
MEVLGGRLKRHEGFSGFRVLKAGRKGWVVGFVARPQIRQNARRRFLAKGFDPLRRRCYADLLPL